MKNKNNTNTTIKQFIDLRMENYWNQGLDLTASYARMTGELQAMIQITSVDCPRLQDWINSSMADALKDRENIIRAQKQAA